MFIKDVAKLQMLPLSPNTLPLHKTLQVFTKTQVVTIQEVNKNTVVYVEKGIGITVSIEQASRFLIPVCLRPHKEDEDRVLELDLRDWPLAGETLKLDIWMPRITVDLYNIWVDKNNIAHMTDPHEKKIVGYHKILWPQ